MPSTGSHPARRAADLLLYGAHYDLDGNRCRTPSRIRWVDGQPLTPLRPGSGGSAMWTPVGAESIITEQDWPRRLVVWSRSQPGARTFQCGLRLRASEVYVVTSPNDVRGLHYPVFVRVAAWNGNPHAREIGDYLEYAKGLDITDQQDLIDLVVARIVDLRHAGERKEHGAR